MFWKNAAANRIALPMTLAAFGIGFYVGSKTLYNTVSGGYDMTQMTPEYGWHPGTAMQGWDQPMSFSKSRTSFDGLNASGDLVFAMHNKRKA